MNYELFIAKRLITGKQYKNTISAPIIKIAIIAITLGIVVMLVAIATNVGLQEKIRDKVSGFNGHIQITNFDNNNSQITLEPISTDQNFYPNFVSVDEIKHIQPFATKAGIIRTETDFEGIVLKGVGPDYDWSFFEEYLDAGNVPSFDTTKRRSNEVLMSSFIANRLGFEIGDEFNTFFLKKDPNKPPSVRVYKIVGLYSTGIEDYDASLVIADLKQVQHLNRWEATQVGGFEVFIDDFDKIKEKGNEIYRAIPSNLNAETVVHRFPGIFEWIKLFDNNVAFIIVLMILVAGINMITALLVLILERTQFIGILKSMGGTNLSIRKVFLYNAAYIILKGLFWGNLIGLSILLIQHFFGVITLDPQTYYVKEAPVYLNVGYIVLLNIGTILLCLLMLIVPSYMVAKISPIKAIKFD
ncbi:FtsX-like permease family protein [Urechidicola sp. KH5]